MSMINKSFENPDADAPATDNAAAAAATIPAATAAATSANAGATAGAGAVATQQGGAVAAPTKGGNMYYLDSLKNALTVEFNTLAQVQGNQGQFLEKETQKSLGDTITMELLSWQDNWVAGPNDDKAPIETVKYSDDGVTTKDGESLAQHIADLKAMGYDKAKISHRVVLVGACVKAAKDHPLVGQLIQIDLPPTGKAQFDRYKANAAWGIRQGTKKDTDTRFLKLEAQVTKGKGTVTYTLVTITGDDAYAKSQAQAS